MRRDMLGSLDCDRQSAGTTVRERRAEGGRLRRRRDAEAKWIRFPLLARDLGVAGRGARVDAVAKGRTKRTAGQLVTPPVQFLNGGVGEGAGIPARSSLARGLLTASVKRKDGT